MTTAKLYVGNLNYKTTADEVKGLFSQYGMVSDAIVIEGKGFGFVTMSTAEEAEKAKDALNGTELGGRTLRVNDAKPSTKRPGGGFDSRGGSRGGSRPPRY
ncbi:MAG: RNA-binding protein [Candidatus Delongbacteria bacterium]|nr:RNA-binding protein [Candidatus Delongbacteria bacterium]